MNAEQLATQFRNSTANTVNAASENYFAMRENMKTKPTCKLLGSDGNAFAVIGTVSKCLDDAGQPAAAKEFVDKAFECGSYDKLLALCFEYVEVE